MRKAGQYDDQQQSANNNGRHNHGAQHGQNDSMRSGTGAAGSSAGAGGGHHGFILRFMVRVMAAASLRFKCDGHIVAKSISKVNRLFAKKLIISHNLPLYTLCILHKRSVPLPTKKSL